jgi:cytochrome c oxidase subunit 3
VAEHAHAVAHQFETAEQQYDSATFGMWVFLVTEVMFFGGVFTAYVVYRSMYAQAFHDASHHLDVWLGSINTAVLISSSLTMALAVRASQLSQARETVKYLLYTMGLGLVFLGIKFFEYHHKYVEHLVPGLHFQWSGADPGHAQIFFFLYFAMTGLHAAHMVIGIVILSIIAIMAHRERFTNGYYTPVEIMGLYWHFVDIIWIFLFPLLYLIGRHSV